MPEIIRNMPDSEYRAIDRLSKHDSDDFARNPYAFFFRKTIGYKKEPTEAMKLGTALHMKTLQPHLFESNYAVIPVSIKQKRGKEWETFQEEHEGKECIKLSQFQQIIGMTSSLINSAGCKQVFSETPYSDRELVLTSEIYDVPIKSKVDIFCQKHGLIADVKTTSDASPDAFMRQASDLGYDVQAAFYLMNAEACGLNVDKFGFFVVENEPPYTTGVYTFDRFSDFVLSGEMEVKRRITEYARHINSKEDLCGDGWIENNLELPLWNKHRKTLEESRK
jgi:hypothetical protein